MNNPTITPQVVNSPFGNFCMSIGAIPTSYKDSLDYYETLLWLIKFLDETVIPAVTTNGNAVAELQNLYIELKDYVEHYFDNLDVQEEINNKLDKMVSDGTLTNLIKDYVDPIYEAFESEISAMVSLQNDRIENQNSRIDTIGNVVNSVVSGSPKGVYTSTSALSSANPATGVYIVTANGHIYSWTHNQTGDPVDLGLYQTAGYTNKSIYPEILKQFKSYNIKDMFHYASFADYVVSGRALTPQGEWSYMPNFKSIQCRIPQNSYIRVSRNGSSDRFRLLTTANPLTVGTSSLVYLIDDASATDYIFYNESDNYLYCTYTSNNEDISVNVEVLTHDLIKEIISLYNTKFFNKEPVNNLYDERNKFKGAGTTTQSGDYYFQKNNDYCTYLFMLEPNEDYTITKTGGNKFRVFLWNYYPRATTYNEFVADAQLNYLTHPSYLVIDDDTETTCTFNSGDYSYCTILFDNEGDLSATFEITNDTMIKYHLPNELLSNKFIVNNIIDVNSDIWNMWNERLAFGMNVSTAPVPTINNQQLFNKGTIITYNTGSKDFNRWGYHVFEAYDKGLYNRITMLLDKHMNEYNKKVAELYYYIGASHKANSYAWFRLGSDVAKHSFMFDRDTFQANGRCDFKNVVTLPRISPTNDLITTYSTVEAADTAYEPENYSDENNACLLYIFLKDAENGSMFYDTDRNKVVVKVNGVWCDMNVTPVPDDTYNF